MDWIGYGSKSCLLSWIGLDWIGLGEQIVGLDWSGFKKIDPCETLVYSQLTGRALSRNPRYWRWLVILKPPLETVCALSCSGD